MDNTEHDDGFNNLEDDLQKSTFTTQNGLGLLSQATLKTKYTKPTIKVDMEKEQPQSIGLNRLITSYLFSVGARVISNVGGVGKQVPGMIASGAKLLFNNITANLPHVTKEAQIEEKLPQAKTEYDPSKESLLIVMPKEVIQADIQTQNTWIQEHRDEMNGNIHIFNPMELNYNLHVIQEGQFKSGFSSPPDPDCDLDTYPEMRENINQFGGLDSYYKSKCYLVSQEDYDQLQSQRSSMIKSQNNLVQSVYDEKVDEEEVQSPKKICLYPYIPDYFTKEDFKIEYDAQIKNYQSLEEEKNQSIQENQFGSIIDPYKSIEQNTAHFVQLPTIEQVQVQVTHKKVEQVQEYEYEYE